MVRVRLLILQLLQVWLVIGWTPRFHLGRPMYGMKIQHEMSRKQAEVLPKNNAFGAVEGYFNQKLDHFDNSSTATWGQRYFANFRYHTAGSNNVFLMLGGEGPESMIWLQNEEYPFLRWAKERGAAVFDLEHRFYGRSRPTADQSVANLRYLSSRQAIEDIATFIRAMNAKHNFGNASWITFGGSYSGALSLWARQKYPDLIAGAVGSSAPLQAEVDYWRYMQIVEDSLRSHSNECAESIRRGFAHMIDLMNSEEGREQLSQLFWSLPPISNLTLTYNDIQHYYAMVYSSFQAAVQYNRDNIFPFARSHGIKEVCEFMNSEDMSELSTLLIVNRYMALVHGDSEGTSGTYDDMVNYLRVDHFNDSDKFDFGARSWTWQMCTEFGFFPSTDGGPYGIFGAVTPLSMYANICSDVFGKEFNTDSIARAVKATNDYYGGADGYRGTNVVIPNGSLDPWHALGKYTSNDPTVVWYLVNGTAHCADMYPPRKEDPPGLTTVRKIIGQNIDMWISKAPSPFEPGFNEMMPREKATHPLDYRNNPKTAFVSAAEPLKKDHPKRSKYRKMHLGRPPHGLRPPPDKVSFPAPLSYESGRFTQPVDHFDSRNPDTFEQRYFKNTQWAVAGGPTFLMIGGEAPESPAWVLNGNLTYLKWAKKFGATVYVLEHRYYGESIVLGPNGKPNEDLTYLSSLQMLYDVANFIRTVNAQLSTPTKWITFGGSYSGALSLWMRELFPDIVHGAVGSSAPVEAKLDFYEYLEVVEASVRSHSQECAENIAKGFNEMHQLVLTGKGREELTSIFDLAPPWDDVTDVSETDVQYFFTNIYGQFQGAVQYSGDNTGLYAFGHGIEDMCAIMTNDSNTPIENVALFNQYMTSFYEDGVPFNHTDNSYSAFVHYLRMSQRSSDPVTAASALWTWQTCTEFGYFQSSDSGYTIFGSPTPVNFFTQMCTDVFGTQFTAASIRQSILKTNRIYGGRDHYRGTNVVIPNGSKDPWHALGKYTSNDPSVVWYLMNGTAHCADMYPARPQDAPDLINTRIRIEDNIAAWLAEPTTSTKPQIDLTTPTVSTTLLTSTPDVPTYSSAAPTEETPTKSSSCIGTLKIGVLLSLISILRTLV